MISCIDCAPELPAMVRFKTTDGHIVYVNPANITTIESPVAKAIPEEGDWPAVVRTHGGRAFAIPQCEWAKIQATLVLIEIPLLEEPCTDCGGDGGEYWSSGGKLFCGKCKGAGHVPTEAGLAVLALIKHNLMVETRDVSWHE